MDDPATLADRYIEYRLETDGLTNLWRGELSHLDTLEDFSPEGVADRRSRLTEFASAAEAAGSSPTLDTIAFTARSRAIELAWTPDLELVGHATGLHTLLLTFLPRMPLSTAEQGNQALARHLAIPPMLDGLTRRLRRNIASGRTPLASSVAKTVASIDGYLATGREADPLLRLSPPRELGAVAAAAWAERLEDIVTGAVRPSLEEYRSFLATTLLPASRPDDRPGICHLDGGDEGYERLVWAHTSTEASAREIHRIGIQQVARLEDEYRLLGAEALQTSDLTEIYRLLREDPALHYGDAEAIAADAGRALARATSAVPEWFGLLPKASCVAETIQQGALAFYSGPAEDGSKPGTFFFNVSDPTSWGTYQVQGVTFHESVPGHHLQRALALELADLHPLHRKLYIAAYNEGWGLYSERLADEMGLYSTPLDRMGMLAADSLRACRLVVDTGMHALGWTRDRAITYMLDHSPMSRHQVEGEIDRYIGDPGQALGYMIGRLEIDRIRAAAEAQLGPRFDIRSFHDIVLGHGTVPLFTLQSNVRTWVASLARAG